MDFSKIDIGAGLSLLVFAASKLGPIEVAEDVSAIKQAVDSGEVTSLAGIKALVSSGKAPPLVDLLGRWQPVLADVLKDQNHSKSLVALLGSLQ